jgi:methyl-accepting chemotaxis protein
VQENKAHRHPVTNFFIKRPLQIKITLHILISVICTSLLTTVVLALVYFIKSPGGHFYYISNDIMQDLKLTNILGVILPSLLIAQAVSIVVGIGIGLYSSRKVAVPIYKFERWVGQLVHGNLNIKMSFRENEEMEELTKQCNQFVDYYRKVFHDLDAETSQISLDPATPAALHPGLARIKRILQKVNYSE